ncbi:ABC transporter permease [Companilactobacillus sp. HBUAS56275]|uniref:ABC transporter permease n=1 Tax=Candidatus Companilactobacillus pullicola TaxID=2838523 RepID=A0A9D2CMJ2_9LACO|nr:ABC transporter permease [Candidatus Companilactobacillus pullicola]
MLRSLKQEFFKFRYQRMPLYGLMTLLILMIYTYLTNHNADFLLKSGFGASQWVIIILITVASSIISIEYQNNTIINLLYKTSQKWQIYLAKFLVMLFYSLFLLLMNLIFTIILKFILFNNYHNAFLKPLLLNLTGGFIYSFFIIALAFLLISWLKINPLVIGIGLVMGFLGASISTALYSIFNPIKWNPLNMIYVSNQLANPHFIHSSHLNNSELIVATCLYAALFLIVGYQIFKKRSI